jgi:thiopeptide-type bacteriocin biosynthesis protein
MISSFHKDEVIDDFLCYAAKGNTYLELCKQLANKAEVDEDNARSFIDELIENQILISALEPVVTGEEMLERVILTLKSVNIPEDSRITTIVNVLQQLIDKLDVIDDQQNCVIEDYKEIEKIIKSLNIPYDVSKLFQVDSFSTFGKSALSKDLQNTIVEGLNVLNQFNKVITGSNLEAFINKFLERYGERELPILEVMDNETGISYGETTNSSFTPLLEGISLTKKNPTELNMRWKSTDSILLDKVVDSIRKGTNNIELEFVDGLKNPNGWTKLPPSFIISFKLLNEGGIQIDNVGGSSAINVIGRFAHGNSDIGDIAAEISKIEEDINNEVILAEIVFLPESRTGNVLLHPSFRTYEIPFLTQSGVSYDKQIPLSDILVSVQNKQVILRSKIHNKQLIPRISTAHNWHESSTLPVYRFLGDLQVNGLQQGIHLQWGNLERQFQCLPRISYKNIVFKPAQWQFGTRDLQKLSDKTKPIVERVSEFREKWRLPRYVVLADGDNDLFIDLESESSFDHWIPIFEKRPNILIKEFLLPDRKGVCDANGETYNHQIAALVYKKTVTYTSQIRPQALSDSLLKQHRFSIGSEWLYFKVYCGTKSAELILTNGIYKAVEEMLSKGIIFNFFFIRYNDPEFHLRLRFELKATSYIGDALKIFRKYIMTFEEGGYISRIISDTYERELIRYGIHTVNLSERIFHIDSIYILKFLSLTEGDDRESVRWLWGIQSLDFLLNDFGLLTVEKMNLFEKLKTDFHKEFETDKIVKDQLNNKYREHRKTIENILSAGETTAEISKEQKNLLILRSSEMSDVVIKLREKSSDNYDQLLLHLLPSYIHMHINRLVTAKSRFHELVIYDLLFNYYRSTVKRVQPLQQKEIDSCELVYVPQKTIE